MSARWTLALAKDWVARLTRLVKEAQPPSSPAQRAAALNELKAFLAAVVSRHPRRKSVLRLVRKRARLREQAKIHDDYFKLLPAVRAVKKYLKGDAEHRMLEKIATLATDNSDAAELARELAIDWSEELVADLLGQQPRHWLFRRLGEVYQLEAETVRSSVHRRKKKPVKG